MKSLLILGRQPELGLSELESLYGFDKVVPAGSQAAVVDVDPCLLAFDRLGGSLKFCKLLTTLDTHNWHQIEKFLIQVAPGHAETMPAGKLKLGLSLYGFNESLKQIEATGLKLKKVIRQSGRSVRLVPNKAAQLNSAQVKHNQLIGPNGWELVFIKTEAQTIIGQTVKVQAIDSYALRDRGRPKRDSRVGMLPPKLAQIIINLAVGKLEAAKLQSICDIPVGNPIPPLLLGQTVLDPFCGTGVLLQEALLMGYSVSGSDLEPRMVDYTKQNLEWLRNGYHFTGDYRYSLAVADATSYNWQASDSFNFIATETYLGRPFTSWPSPEVLAQTKADCNLIIKKFLLNLHSQIKPGTRLCLAVPAWRRYSGMTGETSNFSTQPTIDTARQAYNLAPTSLSVKNQVTQPTFSQLPLVDRIADLGYNRVSFKSSGNEQLIYYREGQIVGRELLVITRI